MALPALNKAEQEFFDSKGESTEGLKPADEVPANQIPEEAKSKPDESGTAVPAAKPALSEADSNAAKVAEDKAAERQRLIKEMGLVPLEALQEARGESKSLKEEIRQLRGWQEAITQQLRANTPQTPVEEIPDVNADPIAYQQWAIGKLAEQNQQMQQWQQQQQAQQQIDASIRQAAQWATIKETEFQKEHPDYPEAWKFVMDSRQKELSALGIRDPQAINAIIAQDAQSLVQRAASSGTNPAELVWSYAAARGYTTKPKAPPPEDKTVQALEKIAAGQQAAGGLRGGSAPAGKIGPQELAAMPVKTASQRAAFAKAWKEAMG